MWNEYSANAFVPVADAVPVDVQLQTCHNIDAPIRSAAIVQPFEERGRKRRRVWKEYAEITLIPIANAIPVDEQLWMLNLPVKVQLWTLNQAHVHIYEGHPQRSTV